MLEDQIKNHFVGHEKELESFQSWLEAPAQQAPLVLFLHDAGEGPKGGIGKSWLLHKCMSIARERREVATAMIDFFSIRDRSGPEIARRVVDALKQVYPDWQPAAFEQVFEQYQQEMKEPKNEEYTRLLRDSLVDDLAELEKKINDPGKHLIIFCDTYERIEQFPAMVSFTPKHIFPDTYGFAKLGFVIAGRNEPDADSVSWHGREHLVRHILVKAFTKQEMLRFIDDNLNVRDILPLQQSALDALYNQTQGRPILVGLLVDLLNQRIITLEKLLMKDWKDRDREDFESYLVGQLNTLENPVDWAVLFMAHAYHRWDREILRWLFCEDELLPKDFRNGDIEAIWQRLSSFSFVRTAASGDELMLHDEMRGLVNKYCWQVQELQMGSSRHDLSESMIRYYERAIAQTQDASLRQAYQVEVFYHRLYVARKDMAGDAAFALLLRELQRALRLHQNVYARALLQEAYGFIAEPSGEQLVRLREQEAYLLMNEASYTKALKFYKELAQRPEIQNSPERVANILRQQGLCYSRMNNFSQAIQLLMRALEMYHAQNRTRLIGDTYSDIGYAYTRQGIFNLAIKSYQDGMAFIEPTDKVRQANAWQNLGEVYRLQGLLDEALIQCKAALHYRQKLNEEQMISEIEMAHILCIIGRIYNEMQDYGQTRSVIQQAFKIYDRFAYRQGIAWTYSLFGDLALAKDELLEADEWFQKAYRTAQHIEEGYVIASLYKRGQVSRRRHEYALAIELLLQAAKRSADINDFYQHTEILIELADVQLQVGDIKKAHEALDRAEALATQYQYFRLLGEIALSRGEDLYSDEHFEEAFEYYKDYCTSMVHFNQAEYQKAVRHTVWERLYALPEDKMKLIWQYLSDSWDLTEEKSLMVQALEQFKDLMLM
ncbi:tetratricopeptide repeat protein [Ktedonosporobacter rubrisoli]|uniref:Tetratricopeptide repeat protein n=1 Tax=Ktedonosporobacter rubrisoli TaxID=2509675 RepID=A0A4V0YZ66_KTERU|nr:tetratricopeptide repeat protein [Ktedonosporobacter rubrisoli]QBD78651.1 tetratricopeptide repeat protein [Ktedonosporobacter rubrisoli]